METGADAAPAATQVAAAAISSARATATTATEPRNVAPESLGRPPAIADRSRLLLVLGTPFALLLAASFVSWPWRSLALPGTLGSLTPPAMLLLVAAVFGAMWALHRNLPIGMITWVPAGQGAIILLTTGFIAETTSTLVGIAVIVAYVIVYFIVLGIALAIAGKSVPLAMAFVAFFVLTQAARFPLFGPDAENTISGAGWLTIVAFLRGAGELALLVWLARRLIEAPDEEATRVTLMIVGLAVAHGLIAAWEDPVLRGDFSLLEVTEQFVRWLFLVGLQMAIAFGVIRIRGMWSTEPRWAEREPEREQHTPDPSETQKTILSIGPARRSGRPSPRRHRRR